MPRRYIFSSESVGEGHPDKVCDTISDAILDACLAQDKFSRVACETFVKSNIVVVGGEITTKAQFDYNAIIRQAIREIGYVNNDDVFHADHVFVNNYITAQSPDIAQGVDAKKAKGKKTAEQGAGDQGLMFGYACNETPELMPAPIMFAHRLGRELTRLRKSGKVNWLRPDAKSQVSVLYEDGKPTAIIERRRFHAALCGRRPFGDRKICDREGHQEGAPEITSDTEDRVSRQSRPGGSSLGGRKGDSGLTGRKIIVDTYGGMGRHGGGAFSGKDPSKVDRSAAYMGRYVAKNVVAAGLAAKCEVQFAYAIGHPEPVSVHIDTFGTNGVPEEKIEAAVLADLQLQAR